MNAVEQLVRAPVAAVEFANLLLTRDDAKIGVTPKDVVWTHRKCTLHRYRSADRTHPIPVLLVLFLSLSAAVGESATQIEGDAAAASPGLAALVVGVDDDAQPMRAVDRNHGTR